MAVTGYYIVASERRIAYFRQRSVRRLYVKVSAGESMHLRILALHYMFLLKLTVYSFEKAYIFFYNELHRVF